jgi:UDP-glucose 4-epimerase
MLILVTGAAGRIGTHLTRALAHAGHTVRAFVLPGDRRTPLIAGAQVELFPGRLEDTAALTAAAQDVEAVFHLGGALTSRGNTDEEFFALNLRSTFALLMAVRAHAPRLRHFVYASSDAVYVSGKPGSIYSLPADESHPRQTGSIYGASKIGAEELCLAFWRGYGIPATILRFGPTADAGELIDPQGVFARWLFQGEATRFLDGLPHPSAEQRESLDILMQAARDRDQALVITDGDGAPEIRQWADARDVAAGCARVLECPAAIGETFNLGGVAPHAANELGAYLAGKLHLPLLTCRLPIARTPWYISSEKARGVLGYAPRYSVFAMVDEAASDRHTAPR